MGIPALLEALREGYEETVEALAIGFEESKEAIVRLSFRDLRSTASAGLTQVTIHRPSSDPNHPTNHLQTTNN